MSQSSWGFSGRREGQAFKVAIKVQEDTPPTGSVVSVERGRTAPCDKTGGEAERKVWT